MITSYLAMQNAICALNMAQTNMMMNSDRMMSSVSFGNSQPLAPLSFQAANNAELQMKANETKVSVLQKLIEAYEKRLAKDIQRGIPKYSGIDYKA